MRGTKIDASCPTTPPPPPPLGPPKGPGVGLASGAMFELLSAFGWSKVRGMLVFAFGALEDTFLYVCSCVLLVQAAWRDLQSRALLTLKLLSVFSGLRPSRGCLREPVLGPRSPSVRGKGLQYPPPPLYKLRPCPSYSRRRDRINCVRNLITYEM